MQIQYEAQLDAIAEEEAKLRDANLDFVERGRAILELCKGIAGTYVTKNAFEKASLLKIITSNLVTDGVTMTPTYEKPFNTLAERLSMDKWRGRRDSNSRPPA